MQIVDDGVLLCCHCHLMLHNRNWRIRRTGGTYFLERPDPAAADGNPDGTLRSTPLPSRSPAAHRLLTPA